MTQLSVMDLAKQGDPQAIAALINRSLASKGIHAEAQLEVDCLNISLKAAQTPNQKAVVAIIHRGMMILQVDRIKRVKIFTYRSDNNYLAWQYELVLDEDLQLASANSAHNDTLENAVNSSQGQLGQSQNMNLVSNPKGVILVQKLSQIQHNLQEYQDIIVRFTDEQVGTVKCLTTLNELIHVVSKPSFLFTSVAANPSLRGLLDAIAESSRTDEHGDQVITNLSILQPGQQWQKAKIRLVSKIFLEPDQEAEESNSPDTRHQGITVDLEETVPQVVYSEEPAIAPIITPTTTPTEPEFTQTSNHSQINTQISVSSDSQAVSANKITERINQQIDPSKAINFTKEIASPANIVETETITLNSLSFLGEDFADAVPSNDQSLDPQLPETITTPKTAPSPIKLDSLDHFAASSTSITANSLFDDFGEDEIPVKIIDDVTAIETNDSLFDQFVDPSPDPMNSSTIHESDKFNESDESDLFGDFIAEPRSRNGSEVTPYFGNNNLNFVTNNEDETVFQEDLAALKARIPKQNLDNLLTLMQEEDNQQSQGLSRELSKNSNPLQGLESKTDIGATTIEEILGNMETITLKPSSTSPNFVTLEDFSEDLESVGF